MDEDLQAHEPTPTLLDASGHPIHHAPTTNKIPAPPRLQRPLSDVGAALVAIVAAAYFWKVQPVSLTGSIVTAGVVVCSVMWLVMDFVPWLSAIALKKRVALTALFGGAFAVATLMLFAHGDLDEPRPNLHGSINAVVPLTVNGDLTWGYWLSVDIENNGGPTYITNYKAFFIADSGRRVEAVVVPPPVREHPIQLPAKGQNGDSLTITYTFDNAIPRLTFDKPIQHDAAVGGILVVRFPHNDLQPPAPTAIQLSVTDRVGKNYTLKYTQEGPSL